MSCIISHCRIKGFTDLFQNSQLATASAVSSAPTFSLQEKSRTTRSRTDSKSQLHALALLPRYCKLPYSGGQTPDEQSKCARRKRKAEIWTQSSRTRATRTRISNIRCRDSLIRARMCGYLHTIASRSTPSQALRSGLGCLSGYQLQFCRRHPTRTPMLCQHSRTPAWKKLFLPYIRY